MADGDRKFTVFHLLAMFQLVFFLFCLSKWLGCFHLFTSASMCVKLTLICKDSLFPVTALGFSSCSLWTCNAFIGFCLPHRFLNSIWFSMWWSYPLDLNYWFCFLQDDKSAICFLLHCQKFVELVRVIFCSQFSWLSYMLGQLSAFFPFGVYKCVYNVMGSWFLFQSNAMLMFEVSGFCLDSAV